MKRVRPNCAVHVLVGFAVAMVTSSALAINIGWVSFHSSSTTPSTAAATAGFTAAPDKGYTDLLAANGHIVTRFVSHDTPTPADLATINAFDLIIISRSVASGHYQQADETLFWNTSVTRPVIHLGGYALRNSRLGLYSGATIPDTAGPIQLTATNPNHPIFAGVALDGSGTMVNTYADVVPAPFAPNTVQRGISVITNPIAGGGTVIATSGTSSDPTFSGTLIAEFPAGVTTADATADVLGGRRLIFLTGSREQGFTAEGAGIYDLAPDGAKMFINAVCYMSACGAPAVPGDTDGNGKVELADFEPIRANFRKSVTMRSQGDLVPNGLVDFADFRQWKAAFLGAGGSVAGLDLSLGHNVPEPTSFGALLIAVYSVPAATRVGRRAKSLTRQRDPYS